MVLDLNGAIVKTKCFIGGVQKAQDVKLSLPEVNFQEIELPAMGKMSVPLPLTENIEATINKIGFDKGLCSAISLSPTKYEFRWAQTQEKANGTSRVIGCKAFITGKAKSIPGGDIEVGSSYEGAIPIDVRRYQVYVDGKEQWLIDKVAEILRINGKDYAADIKNVV